MKPDGTEALAVPQPATPSLAEQTRTAESYDPTPPSPTATPPSAPQHRDPERYQLLGEHGRGGLGRVSRAHDRELGRDVAIKELISRGHVSEIRFLREALITARLEHPGIVPVHEAGRWPDGTPFYAMKLVAGRSLRDLLAERKTVGERIALLHHVIAVADAIAYAHGKHIIHRDLKPANVIVGDFGETVVIDWGLAKDLTEAEESATGGGPFHASRRDDVTETGAVLGTPAYMAPEQQRGEPVDQRADVFAIGAMLWELCALQRVPPAGAAERRRTLRGAGIDADLVTIIDKAVDPDPARRYPDAGALAADLKAFKAGARIAARHYSLLAMFAHWTRRHRTLAVSIASAVALAIVASILYVRNIAVERDRADTALARAEAAKNDLILEHAALQLRGDPTTALTTLGIYHGGDSMRRSELLAEAHGRGVARDILHPHNDTIWFLTGQPDGSFISVGEDHRVQRTLNGTTTNLATNVSYTVYCAYSSVRSLLAYSASPNGVALMNLTTSQTATLDAMAPVALAFTPDGSRLAALGKRGEVIIWKTSPAPEIFYRGSFPDAISLTFPQPSRLLLLGRSRLTVMDFERSRSSTYDHPLEAVDANERYLAASSSDGTLAVLSPSLDVLATAPVCKQRVKTVTIVPKRDVIAFGCDEGAAGLARYSPSTHSLAVIDTFNTAAAVSLLVVDSAEANVLAISDRTTYVHNIDAKITQRLEGQPARISAIATPTPGFPYILTADVKGTVRVWDPPAPRAQVLGHVPGLPLGSRFSPDSTLLAIYGTDPVIRLLRMADASTIELRGHTDMVGGVRFSRDGQLLVSFSWDGSARIWRTSDGTLLRTFEDHRSAVEESAFIQGSESVASIGDDGHLFAWNVNTGDTRSFLTNSVPLVSLQVLSNTNEIVTHDALGSLWVVTPTGDTRLIRQGNGIEITFMRASQDGKLLAIGQEDGSVMIYRTVDWTTTMSLQVGGTIAMIEFDPQDRDIFILSEDGFVHLAPLDARRSVAWRDFQVEAHHIAYAPDGDVITISARDGGSWFYSIPRARWSYQRDHDIEVRSGLFSPDGRHFVSIDRNGLIVARDSSMLFD